MVRAALHIHSTWSYDGSFSLDQIAEIFSERDYDVLLITEHDQGFTEDRRRAHRDACQSASTDRLLIIPGLEYSDAANKVHILVWGDVPFLGTEQETQSLLERATGQGGVCVFAHPSRKAAWQVFSRQWLTHLTAVELWNRKTDGWAPSPEAGEIVLQTGILPIVGIDFHTQKQMFPLTVCFDHNGPRDERKVLEALRLGSYRCEAFGRDLKTFTGGIGRRTTTFLESGRRLAARAYRSLAS